MGNSRSIQDRHIRIIAGSEIYVDWEDFLWEPNDWTEPIAEALALEQGIGKLSEIQWEIIRFMRNFYFYEGRSPMNKELKAGTGHSIQQLEALFPGGIRLGARRIAGLPNPKACL